MFTDEEKNKLKLCTFLIRAIGGSLGSVTNNESRCPKPWPRVAPSKFLKRNDGQVRDLLPLRVVDTIEECKRCFKVVKLVSELDTKLTTFVCSECRQDSQEWDFLGAFPRIPITVEAMNNQMRYSISDEKDEDAESEE